MEADMALRFPDINDSRRQELRGRQAECVELYWDCQLTQEQVAGMLGISRQAVQKHLRAAWEKLNSHSQPSRARSIDSIDESRIRAMA